MKIKALLLLVGLLAARLLLQGQSTAFLWAGRMGGGNSDVPQSMAVDADGNVYTTGKFYYGPSDFDPGSGTYNLSGTNWEVFVSKLDASGNFVWAKQIGGSGVEWGNSIAIDNAGNVYTAGMFYGTTDFDPGSGTYNLTSGYWDIFISKLDAAGNFVWAKALSGASNNEEAFSISLDAEGNVYTTGYFAGTVDFDPGPGTYNLTSAGSYDIFISKLDTDGNFVWAKRIGGTSDDRGNSISIGTDGNVHITGKFYGTVDFDPGSGTYNLISTNVTAFVLKLNALGNFVWAKIFESSSTGPTANSISVDASGNVFTTGSFNGTVDFDPGSGTYYLTNSGTNLFISKLDASGNFGWAKMVHSTSSNVYGYSITTDDGGNVYTTGYYPGTSTDFDPGTGTYYMSGGRTFILKLNASGDFVWANSTGSPSSSGSSIAVDVAGNVYTAGWFTGTGDFDPGSGTYNLTSAGNEDIFIVKLSQQLPMVTTQAISDIGSNSATGNGTILDLGNPDPTAHGMCWNTTGTPTLSNNYTDNGAISSTGSFTVSLTGLTPATTYYVRAFATNINGTVYGNQVSFTTDQILEFVWTGTTNIEWDVASNWDLNQVPGSNGNVTIPDVSGASGNFPLVSVAALCNNLTIASGAQLTIDTDGSLTAGGAFTNNGNMRILSDATGTGSFMDNGNITGSGTNTVQVYLTADQYHGFAPPVTDALSGIFKLPNSYMPDVYLYQNVESTYSFNNIVPVDIPLNSMEGYFVWVDGLSASPAVSSWTFDITGTLATGSIGAAGNLAITSPGGFERGWNFVGNPYPSAIDWDAASGWTKTGINATIYLYSNGIWATYNTSSGGTNGGSRYIATAQGFYVKVTDPGSGYPVTGTLNMNNNVRVHNNVGYLKNEIAGRVMLQLSSDNRTDETGIMIHPQASNSFDIEYDAYKILPHNISIPQLYSVSDAMYAMNCIPVEQPVTIAVTGGIPGDLMTITAIDKGEREYLYLEDTFTGLITDLNGGSCTFINEMNQENRFVLHFTPLAVKENPAHLISIYSSQKDVYVKVPVNTTGDIIIYNLLGQEVATSAIDGVSNKITLNESAYYLIQVVSNEAVVTQKVFVK